MAVKHFSFCILVTGPKKHALTEIQLFTAPWHFMVNAA